MPRAGTGFRTVPSPPPPSPPSPPPPLPPPLSPPLSLPPPSMATTVARAHVGKRRRRDASAKRWPVNHDGAPTTQTRADEKTPPLQFGYFARAPSSASIVSSARANSQRGEAKEKKANQINFFALSNARFTFARPNFEGRRRVCPRGSTNARKEATARTPTDANLSRRKADYF